MIPIIRFIYPHILFHRKTDDGIECGPFITKLDTGIFYSRYDYGYIFQISILGFGVNIVWTNL